MNKQSCMFSCNNPLCQSLSPHSRELLQTSAEWVDLPSKADRFFHLENRKILILEKGAIIGYRSGLDIRRQSIALIGPGDLLGIVSLFSDREREPFLITPLVDSAGCLIPRAVLESLVQSEPDLCSAVMRQFSSRYSRVVDSFLSKTLDNSTDRVLYAIRELKDIGISASDVTHENLALLAGLNRVTVTKVLAELSRKSTNA